MTSISKKLRNIEEYFALDAVQHEQILKAEEILLVNFDKDYTELITNFCSISQRHHEIVGICSSKQLSVVDVTIEQRVINTLVTINYYVIEQANIDGINIW